MSIGERVRYRLVELNISQAELARRVGLTQATINGLVRGKSRSSAHLHRIASELRTTPEYLAGQHDDPSPAAAYLGPQPVRSTPQADSDDVEVDSIDIGYGMGGTYLDDDGMEVDKLRFSRGWLRTFTPADPGHLFVAQGHGDSMQPTIQDSDVVLVDRSQREPKMRDQLWAMSVGGIGMIKRLRPQPDGSMRILSDNALVPEDRATDGELYIHGRVVAIVRKV